MGEMQRGETETEHFNDLQGKQKETEHEGRTRGLIHRHMLAQIAVFKLTILATPCV